MNGRDTERPWVPRKRKQQAVRLALLLLLLAAATASSVSYAQDGGQAHPNETQLPVDPPFTPDGEALETPPAPDLIAPAQAGRTCDSTPTFDWSDVSLAQRYHIQVGDSASFTPPAIDQYTGSSNYTPSSALAAGKYYWRVRARDASRWSSWSGARYFFVDAPTVPTLLSPAHDSRICDAISTLSWAGGPRPTTYRIQISSMYSFPAGSLAIDATTSASSFTPRRTLGRKRWYWRVREEGSCGNSAYSDVRDFIVSACRAPNLRTPDDGAHTCNPIQEFGWSGVIGATSYRLQMDNNASFSSPVIDTGTSRASYTLATTLSPGTYYWRVRASVPACGDTPWSSVRRFVMDPPPAVPSGPSPPNGATGVGLEADLDWADSAGARFYDVYFGSWLPPHLLDSVGSSQFALSALSPNTRYYWRVVAVGNCLDPLAV